MRPRRSHQAAPAHRAALVVGLIVALLTATQPGAAGPRPIAPVTSGILVFDGAGTHVSAAAIDATGTYAFYGTLTGTLLRVRLSDLSTHGAVWLAAGRSAQTIVVDPASGYLYVGMQGGSSPNVIVKVNPDPLAVVATLELPPALEASSGAIDPLAGYAYFGTDSQPAQILRVRLSDFSLSGSLTLAPGEDRAKVALIDPAGGYAYFGLATQPGRIVRVRLAGLGHAGTLELAPGEEGFSSAVLYPGHGSAYFFTRPRPGRVIEVRLADFTRGGSLTLGPEDSVHAAAIDTGEGYAYLAKGNDGASWWQGGQKVAKLRLVDLTIVGETDVAGGGWGGFVSSALLAPGGIAYFTASNYDCSGILMYCWWLTAALARVDLVDFRQTRVVAIGENRVTGAARDGAGYAYFSLFTGQIIKVRLPDYARVATINLPSEDDQLTALAADPARGYLYAATGTAPGRVLRVRLADFAVDRELVLEPDEAWLSHLLIDEDRGYLYVTSGGTLIRVRLADFTRAGRLGLPAGIRTGVIDTAAGYAYYALDDESIAKVRLADFRLVAGLPLNSYWDLSAGAIDPLGGYAYFAAADTLYRIRLADFRLAGTLNIGRPVYVSQSAHAAAVDAESGLSYWAVDGCEPAGTHGCWWAGWVTIVRLADFGRSGEVPGSLARSVGLFDPVGGTFAFGRSVDPGVVDYTDIGLGAEIGLDGSAPVGVHAGEALTYTLQVGNAGPRGAAGIVLTATLPAGAAFRSGTPGCAASGLEVVCHYDAVVRVGASAAVTVSILTDPAWPPGPFGLPAIVSAREPDPWPVNNRTVVTASILLRQGYLPAALLAGPP